MILFIGGSAWLQQAASSGSMFPVLDIFAKVTHLIPGSLPIPGLWELLRGLCPVGLGGADLCSNRAGFEQNALPSSVGKHCLGV